MIKADSSFAFPSGSHSFVLRFYLIFFSFALLRGQGFAWLLLGSMSRKYTSCLYQGKVKSQIFGERKIIEEPRDFSQISSSSRSKHSSDITVATVGHAWNTEKWKLQFGNSLQMYLWINHSSFSFLLSILHRFQRGLIKDKNMHREPCVTGQESSHIINFNSALCYLCCANGNVKGSGERARLSICHYYRGNWEQRRYWGPNWLLHTGVPG